MTKLFENALKAVKPDGMDQSCVIPSAYDLGLEDLSGLCELALSGKPNGPYHAIVRAFMFGFVMGNRCTLRRKLKRL